MFLPRKNSVLRLAHCIVPACLASLALTGCRPTAQIVPPPPEVATVIVAEQPILLTTELPGRTASYRCADVRPQVNGLIQKRLFVEGSDVLAGQELYQIDPAPFQAALDSAAGALARAEANLPAVRLRANRYQDALADKSVSQQDYDDAHAALKQAEADVQYYKALVETARINLAYAHIVSPIPGRIGVSSATEGAIVTAYQPNPLATVQQLDPIYVDVTQSTAELLRLQRHLQEGRMQGDGTNASAVDLILEDGTRYPLKGTLQFRDVSVDPSTASVTLRMVFPNPSTTLLPGMFVRTVVEEGIAQKAILIPQQSVSRDPRGNPLALTVDASEKVVLHQLVLDRAIRDQWYVVSGLAPGDRLIVEGMQNVKPGVSVKAVPFDAARKPESAPAAAAHASK